MFKAEQKSEKAPGYRGDIMLGGVVYEISAWVKEGKNGKFFSLSGKPKGQVPVQSPSGPFPTTGSIADMADDIPFLFNCSTERDMMGLPKSLWRARYGKELQILRANEIDC